MKKKFTYANSTLSNFLDWHSKEVTAPTVNGNFKC